MVPTMHSSRDGAQFISFFEMKQFKKFGRCFPLYHSLYISVWFFGGGWDMGVKAMVPKHCADLQRRILGGKQHRRGRASTPNFRAHPGALTAASNQQRTVSAIREGFLPCRMTPYLVVIRWTDDAIRRG